MDAEIAGPAVPDPMDGPFEEPDAADATGLGPLLAVGKPVVWYPAGQKEDPAAMERAVVRGWHPGGYLLLELPHALPDESPLSVGDPLLVKFRHDRITHEFDTVVQECWTGLPTAHCIAAWPEAVRRVEVRRHERIVSLVQVNMVTEGGTWLKGQLRDLSAGGCKLYLKTPTETGVVVQLSFTLPDGSTLEDVRAFVRAVNPFGKGALVSCQFDSEEADAQEEVDLYVATALDEARARHLPDRRRVVVIDNSPKLMANLRRALDQRGFDVAVAAGPVDGFAVLRSTMPHALLLNQAQAVVSGFELCRMVRATPGFRTLPVFVYGPDNDALAALAREAGATNYIPYLVSAGHIADTVLSGQFEE